MRIESFEGEYSFLSNFYPCRIEVEQYVFNNAEAVFQAMKCKQENDRDAFQSLTGAEAKKLGRRIEMRDNWDNVKVEAMRRALLMKFTQNPVLAKKLVMTGDAELIEGNQWHDTFWGVCNGVGANYLGMLLMELRGVLKNEI